MPGTRLDARAARSRIRRMRGAAVVRNSIEALAPAARPASVA
jgi:hypothetical protein